MSNFFFHVDIELISTQDSNYEAQIRPGDLWSEGAQALAPFLIQKKTQKATPSITPWSQGSRLDFPHSSLDDKRLDHINIEGTNMAEERNLQDGHHSDEDIVTRGIGSATSGLKTKGRYIPFDQKATDSTWGIVHLYRDAEETAGLSDDSLTSSWQPKKSGDVSKHAPPTDQDCTTLCILAVPSYLSPSDFLGFVGEETRDAVSHFRMIRTSRANRYMVLMKFRNGKRAREWQKEWNGKVFNSMEVSIDWLSSYILSLLTVSSSQRRVMSSFFPPSHCLRRLLQQHFRP